MSYLKSEKEVFLIGKLAEAAGTSRDTLRHYERKGVLKPPLRSAKGYRLYSPAHVERIKMIRRALAVGFTLDEIARIFAERERGKAPCREVYALAAKKLNSVNERIIELEAMRGELETLVAEWDEKLQKASENKPVRLLEDLAGAHPMCSEDSDNRKVKRTAENLRRKK